MLWLKNIYRIKIYIEEYLNIFANYSISIFYRKIQSDYFRINQINQMQINIQIKFKIMILRKFQMRIEIDKSDTKSENQHYLTFKTYQ